MRSVKRIVKIHDVENFNVKCLFNNGESRVIDFGKLFKKWNLKKDHIAYKLTESVDEFKKLELESGTITWKNVKFKSRDDLGNEVEHYFDLDPIVLYENSEVDTSRTLKIGMKLRQVRKELGLTQEELAKRSGTTKHYISRIENNKSGIEVMTLKKIVEGLGKKLQISIN